MAFSALSSRLSTVQSAFHLFIFLLQIRYILDASLEEYLSKSTFDSQKLR